MDHHMPIQLPGLGLQGSWPTTTGAGLALPTEHRPSAARPLHSRSLATSQAQAQPSVPRRCGLLGQPATAPRASLLCMLSARPGCSMLHAHSSRPAAPPTGPRLGVPCPAPSQPRQPPAFGRASLTSPLLHPGQLCFDTQSPSFLLVPTPPLPGLCLLASSPRCGSHSNLLHSHGQGPSREQGGRPLPQRQLHHGGLSQPSQDGPASQPVNLTNPGRRHHHEPTASPSLKQTYFFNKLLRQNSTLHVFNSWDKTVVDTFTHTHPCGLEYALFLAQFGRGGWPGGRRISRFGIWRETLTQHFPQRASLVSEEAVGRPVQPDVLLPWGGASGPHRPCGLGLAVPSAS